MAKIDKIRAREILDSRGNPTVEADVILDTGDWGRAAVPSGASTGQGEALELRDGGSRYLGKGVTKAVRHIREIIFPELKGQDISELLKIDEIIIKLDGTENKAKLGANALLAVSMACMKAYSSWKKQPLFKTIGRDKAKILPVPLMNILWY